MRDLVSISGHLIVTLRHDDGRSEVVFDDHNQVTYRYLDCLAELISQVTGDPLPASNAIHSLWVEGNLIGVSAPTPDDTIPDPSAEIVYRKEFEDGDIFKTTTGDVRAVEFHSRILKGEANGKTLQAACLFTKGTISGLPSLPYVAGDDGAWMVARQLIGPIPKEITFAVDLDWGMTFQILDI